MFKQRKHKTFNYKPRFSKDSNASEIEDGKNDFTLKWRKENGKKVRGGLSIRFLILALVLLLICMYLLEKKYM
ncbi:hypothetical protein [Hyunsoonleella pacifica]|uniref:Uncharacterized protein n=1 Tax=Hyunsoonleella pacifica TaxID=1080224 RepID=A0A4Q9FS10_9FLAO|nr:hypothetical protein [Hyunsoonleella pacifica]TBN18586.1 hypothetical protein EYD46_00535 [Hyunsoonleella pacifica]GGD03032.1 hypothetical protein GCM10011368_01080 [Hyunsoonleella pacifica]